MRKVFKFQIGLLLLIPTFMATAQVQQELSIELIMFSGRPPPKANITDSSLAKSILDSLDIRSNLGVPCNEIPSIESTPAYTGVLLTFKIPVLNRKAHIINNGYMHYDTNKPCYRDPGRNLEKMCVHAAFQYDDLNAPGGPRSMGYLACMVPDSLHPDIAPCTVSAIANRRKILVPGHSLQAPLWVFTLDGRRVRPIGRLYYLPYLK